MDTRKLEAEVRKLRYFLGRVETRLLEMPPQMESVLREALERERERADRLEAELAMLRRDAPETALEGAGNGHVLSDHPEPVERRSWLYRFFFGP